ncbi:hypothetical protein ABG768_020799 [Culter alburnus]|uniref:Large ribosomal subunit protein mL42 n=1 Tax=Culter alburnus TaxID=194366 RepID=A0AAW2ASF3_CULAL
MASGHISRLASLFYTSRNLKQFRGIFLSSHNKSTLRGPSFNDSSNVEIAVTSDGNTIVCYHPSEDVPYELTQPIVRPDAVSDHAETHEQVLKARLGKEVLNNKKAPTIEELSKMFYTTKHRWYPRRTVSHQTPKPKSTQRPIVLDAFPVFSDVCLV